MPIRIALTLMLLCLASAAASARDVRHLSPDGEGACPEATLAGDAPASAGESRPAGPAHRARSATARGADGGGGRTPRWHSFLPGMFR